MGKTPPPQNKAEELRAASREANAILGDLKREKREIEKFIESLSALVDAEFEKRVSARLQRAEQDIGEKVLELSNILRNQADKCMEALLNRWRYVSTMCLADPTIGHRIAITVLKKAGGTFDLEDGKWHLVREQIAKDGAVTFAFPREMAGDAAGDAVIEDAIRQAVKEYNPTIRLRPWSTHERKETEEL